MCCRLLNSPYKCTSNASAPCNAAFPSRYSWSVQRIQYADWFLHLHRILQCIWSKNYHTPDGCAVWLSPWSYCCWCNVVVFTPLCLWVFVVGGDIIAVVVLIHTCIHTGADTHSAHPRNDGDLKGCVGALPGTHSARICFQSIIRISSDIFGWRHQCILHRNNYGARPSDRIRCPRRQQCARLGVGYHRRRGGRAGTSEAAVIDVGAGILVGNGVLRPTEDAL